MKNIASSVLVKVHALCFAWPHSDVEKRPTRNIIPISVRYCLISLELCPSPLQPQLLSSAFRLQDIFLFFFVQACMIFYCVLNGQKRCKQDSSNTELVDKYRWCSRKAQTFIVHAKPAGSEAYERANDTQ
jgi:hypothetical protein